MTEHNLKTWTEYFQAIKSGEKTFEFRVNDRDYQLYDILNLQEFFPDEQRFSGDYLKKKVTYLLGKPFVPEGYVIMSWGSKDKLAELLQKVDTEIEKSKVNPMAAMGMIVVRGIILEMMEGDRKNG